MLRQLKDLREQVEVYRHTLLTWLGALAAVLLLLLLAVLRWSLAPLRKVAADLARVEHGAQERLDRNYPVELSGLTASLNNFIDAERDRVVRYRNTLSDLAHSLKTPLAVMRSQLEIGGGGEELRWTVLEQVGRMDEIVAYQLSRAATSGHQTFAAPLLIEPYAEEIVRSLEKVYASRGVLCEFEIDPGARFHGDQGDLMELLGNLLENAFKWAKRRVVLHARVLPAGVRRAGLEFAVEDDGPGIAEDKVEHLLQRGVRGDERVQGHGIGLAIVQDIVKAYRGEVNVGRSPQLGGARFLVRLAAR
jgi:two-component system sensor histidine kinase PhoQ